MGTLANIVCKGVGIAGMSAVIYDAASVAKLNSKRVSQAMDADHFEKVLADTRTLSTESHINNAMQKKLQNWRMNNPVISFTGSVKGYVGGFLGSLGDNIIPTAFASLALAAKGTASKVGAWGVAGYALYTILKEGFGFSKKSPMD